MLEPLSMHFVGREKTNFLLGDGEALRGKFAGSAADKSQRRATVISLY